MNRGREKEEAKKQRLEPTRKISDRGNQKPRAEESERRRKRKATAEGSKSRPTKRETKGGTERRGGAGRGREEIARLSRSSKEDNKAEGGKREDAEDRGSERKGKLSA